MSELQTSNSKQGPGRRKWPRLLLLGFLCVLLASPWWSSWALELLLGRQGIQASCSSSHFGTRLQITKLSAASAAGTLSVDYLEGDSLPLLLLHRCLSKPGPVEVRGLALQITQWPKEDPSSPPSDLGVQALLDQASEGLALAAPWLSELHLDTATLRFPRPLGEFRLQNLHLLAPLGKLELGLLEYRGRRASVQASLNRDTGLWSFALAEQGGDFKAEITAREGRADLHLSLHGREASGTALFEPDSWLPKEARLDASDLEVKASDLWLPPGHETARLSLALDWHAGRLHYKATLSDPAPTKSGLVPKPEPLLIDVQGSGIPGRWELSKASASWSGAKCLMTEPFVVDDQFHPLGASRFDLAIDLSKQGLGFDEGRLEASLNATLDEEGLPKAQGTLQARALRYGDLVLTEVTTSLALKKGVWTLSEARLTAPDGAVLSASGAWNQATNVLAELRLHGDLQSRTLGDFLPSELSYETLGFDLLLSGPVPSPDFEGSLSLKKARWGRHPIDALSVSASGRGREVTKANLSLSQGEFKLQLQGSGDLRQLQLTQADFTKGDTQLLSLVRPATLRLESSPLFGQLELSGKGRSLTCVLGEKGIFNVQLTDEDLSWLPFPPALHLSHPQLSLNVSGLIAGPDSRAEVKLQASATVEGQPPLSLELQSSLEDGRLEVSKASLSTGPEKLADLSGSMPWPRGKLLPEQDLEDIPLNLKARLAPDKTIDRLLQEFLQLTLEDFTLDLSLSGSLRQPEISLALASRSVRSAQAGGKLPPLGRTSLGLRLRERTLFIDRLESELDGCPLSVTGRIQIPETPRSANLRDWLSGGDLFVETGTLRIASLAPLWPQYLAARGEASLKLQLKPGLRMNGRLEARDAALRPISGLGTLNEIRLDARLDDRRITLDTASALLSGHPVSIEGYVDLADPALPIWDLRLKGEDVPLIRKPGLAFRGNLALQLKTQADASTLLSGEVRLLNSHVIMGLEKLTAGSTGSGEKNAPYFSVQQEPFRDWRLKLRILGNRAIKIRLPVFEGVVTPDFRLEGTLGAPVAIGEATCNRGRIFFPFAVFEVAQGSINLTQANPLTPGIQVTANARQSGEELSMLIHGPVTNPSIEFSSASGLSDNEVILFITTGSAPSQTNAKGETQRMLNISSYLGLGLIQDLVGHRGGESRITMQSGERISAQGKETFKVEYILGRDWKLVGEYDEYDAYNLDLKWHFYPWGDND